jgi:hypothetical protein
MSAPLVGLGIGFLLGLRFKVTVLVLVVLAAIVLLMATGGVNWSNVGWTVLTAVAIEAGYVIGLIATNWPLKVPLVDWRRISQWRRHTRL